MNVKKEDPAQIMVEYNGMWSMDNFFNGNMPPGGSSEEFIPR